ncbi:MAG: ribonuclease HI family protein [Sphingomonas sp.]|nr:ribonuclease HI family protein [Sphingomonas sp.]
MRSERTKLYFDGGCRPNPGPMETAVVVRGETHIRTGLHIGGNDEAEWLALIHAAEIAIALQLRDVTFIGDSALIVHQAQGRWKCRSAEFSLCLDTFRALALHLPQMRLRHVPRARNLAGIALELRHRGL